jgi:tetratricopeptide (TPR) repeat protein
MNKHSTTHFRRWAAIAGSIAFAAGCATTPPPAPAPAPAPVEAPQPVAPAAPELTPAQAKAEAQKLAIQAIDLLQNGDEAGARGVLDKASALDPSNDLARKLADQINADPQKELGAAFFRYTVQRDDSLSKIAAAYLGDRFRFYILARYNDIANPSRLAAGQVIKIPGKERPPAAAAGARPGTAPAPVAEPAAAPAAGAPEPAPAPAPAPAAAQSDLMEKGIAQQKAGNLEGAYASFNEAVRSEPGNRDAIMQRDGVKAQLIRKYDREAQQAYQRQNLDLAITKWDQILALDPSNQKAKLERERALELKKKLTEKFGPGSSSRTTK